MTFFRRLTVAATAILGLVFAAPASAQGVPPLATTEDTATEAAIAAFARALFEDDYDGMLAELPDMIAATRAEGDTGTTAVLEAIRDALASDNLEDMQRAFRAFARLSTYGMAKRVYDALLDIAVTLGPTEGFTLWIRTGVVRTAELESLDWLAIDGVSVLSHRSTPPAFAAGLDFNGTNIRGLPGFWVRAFYDAGGVYEASGTVLLVGPNGAITPASFDMVPGERRLVAGTTSVDASWVEALRHADAIVAVFVLGNGNIAQVRFELDRRGRAALSDALTRWGYR